MLFAEFPHFSLQVELFVVLAIQQFGKEQADDIHWKEEVAALTVLIPIFPLKVCYSLFLLTHIALKKLLAQLGSPLEFLEFIGLLWQLFLHFSLDGFRVDKL